jgi:hypothetical protein
MNKRVPARWLLFQIFNYLTLLPAIGTLLYLVYLSAITRYLPFNVPLLLIIVSGMSILIFDSIINLLLMEKYYPDKMPGKLFLRIGAIINILATIFKLPVIFIAIVFIIELLTTPEGSYTGFAIFLFFQACPMAIALAAVPVFVLRSGIQKLIKWNYNMAIDRFLNDENDSP